MEYLVSAILVMISTVIRTIFYDAFMQLKKSAVPFWVAIIFFAVVGTFCTNIFDQWTWLKHILNVLIGVLVAIALYNTSIWRSIFCSILYLAIASLVDVASSYLLVVLSGKPISELRAGFVSFLIGVGVSHILLLTIALTFKKTRKNKDNDSTLSYAELLRLLIFPIVSAFVLVTMFNDAVLQDEVSPLLFASVVGLMAANIALVFIMDKLEQEQQAREENRILQQQIQLEMNNINALMGYSSSHAQIAHDHSNHLSTIQALLAKRELDVASTYVEKLCKTQVNTQYIIHTNNSIADAVLNLKYHLAKRNNVHMSFDVNDLSLFPLQREELATVLSNVLDNAIEACVNVPSAPAIRVKIIYDQDESLISIQNTTACPVQIKDNKVHTTKMKAESHGFGLKNVATVLAKHGYNYAIGYEEGWFQFTAVL